MAGSEATGDWIPRKGDIVRLKPGFDRTLEAIAARRAGLPLAESARFEVLGCARGEESLVLTLRQVRVVRIAGAVHVTALATAPFPYVSKRFEPL